jgi:tetratricopeptide (TPR) repeat protein
MHKILIGLAVVLAVLPVAARADEEWDRCAGTTSSTSISAEARIGSCTQLINSGRLSPADMASIYTNRAFAYVGKGLTDQAIADYTKAIELEPENAVAYAGRGIQYGNKGLYDQALADENKSIALQPNDARTYNNRGIIFMAKGYYGQTIADATKAIALDPGNALGYALRGFANEKTGLRNKAIADYRAALKIDPSNKEAQSGLKNLGASP